jgi:hypothetical protein
MRWIGKVAPIYVWEGDTWYNELDRHEYQVDIPRAMWICGEKQVFFTKKTQVIK